MTHPRVTSRFRRMLVCAAAGACLAAPGAWASGAPAPEATGVIVEMAPNATAAERARVARELQATTVRDLGGAGLYLFATRESRTRAQAQAEVAGLDAVDGVSLNLPVTTARTPNDPCWSTSCAAGVTGQPDMVKIGLAGALDWMFPGGPVTVAVIDTAVALDHPDLAPRLWTNADEIAGNGVDDDANGVIDDIHGADFVNESTDGVTGRDGDPNDVSGAAKHGTHVAGAIGAAADNGIGIAGIAPQARLMSVRFLADANGGTMADAVSAINYAVDNGAQVINNSWVGWSLVRGSDAVCVAVRRALDAGIIVVSAAGNNGRDIDSGVPFGATTYYPIPATCYDSATTATPGARADNGNGQLTVLATDNNDALAGFSNWSSQDSADLAAPGLQTLSTYVSNATGTRTLGYDVMSGTSMASPHVAGAAAMLWAANPGLSAASVRSAIASGADPVSSIQGKSALGVRLSLPGMLVAGNATRDTTPPVAGAMTAPPDGGVIESTQVEFRWQPATDAASVTYALYVDGALQRDGISRTDATLAVAEGRHTWHVVARDYYGNAATSAAAAFVVDVNPPSGLTALAPGDGATLAGRATLRWSPATDASGISHYHLRIDGQEIRLDGAATEHTVSGLAGGGHTWSLTAVDGVGRTTVFGPWSFTILPQATPPAPAPIPDTGTPPAPGTPLMPRREVGVQINGGARATATRTVQLAVAAPAGATRFRWGSSETGLGAFPWMDLAPGGATVLLSGTGRTRAVTARIAVEVADASGAVIAAGADDIILDMAPPRISVERTPSGRWRVRASDESGPVRIQARGGRWRVLRNGAATIASPSGLIRARDALGNTSPWARAR